MNEEIVKLIGEADHAIREERFDDLMSYYTEDAILVVKPGLEVQGKDAIKKVFLELPRTLTTALFPHRARCI